VGVNFNGKSATNLTHLAVLRVFGKDGRFTPEEHMVLEDCWNDVLAESSIELTPKKALAVTVVSIFAARLTQPCGEPALQRIFGFFGALADRIKAWWARRKVGSTARQAERFRQKREAAAEESG